MSEPSGKLYLGLHAEEIGRELTGQYQWYHVRLTPVRIYESGHIRGITWGYYSLDREGQATVLADLQVNCQGSAHEREKGVYAWDTEFRDVHSIDARRAASMAKTLAHVDKTLHRLEGQWGHVATYGQYCLRVAKALGAVEFVTVARNERFRGYDDTDLHRKSLGDGADTIDWWIRCWQQAGVTNAVANA